jgi:hypothetical protein
MNVRNIKAAAIPLSLFSYFSLECRLYEIGDLYFVTTNFSKL